MSSKELLPSMEWGPSDSMDGHAQAQPSLDGPLSVSKPGTMQGEPSARQDSLLQAATSSNPGVLASKVEASSVAPNENKTIDRAGRAESSIFADNVVNIEERQPEAQEDDEYEHATGETLDSTLDINSWDPARRLADAYGRFEREVAEAVKAEALLRTDIRYQVLPRLPFAPGAPQCAGHFASTLDQIRSVQNKVLFNGLTQAVDGTSVTFETLPLKMVQIGVGLVNYSGDSGTWAHRIYRRDVRMRDGKLVEEALAILEKRGKRAEERANISELLRRAVMTYGERAVLTDKATAPWRMGHGNPLAYELLTGSGDSRIIELSLPLLRRLVIDHKRFLFIPSETKDELLLTIGNALRPLEYAIVKDFNDYLKGILNGHFRGEGFDQALVRLEKFAADVGSALVMGTFKASPYAPARVFYAHHEHAHEAALIAIADSILLDHRGFPMLLDLADRLCAGFFGRETLVRPAMTAFAQTDEASSYLPERQTRVA